MKEKDEFEIVPRIEIFKMTLRGTEEIMNAKSVEYYKKYWTAKDLGEPVSIGEAGPEDVMVRCIDSSYRNCYATATYEISSATKLTELDMCYIRARYSFMGGQVTAAVRNMDTPEEREGRYIYVARSECDSGD